MTTAERGPPAIALGEAGQQRQEDELAGGGAGGQHADDQAAPVVEPARRHRRAQHQGSHAGADADDDAPQQHELPDLGHGEGGEDAGTISASAALTTWRTPKRFMKAAANGPIRPNRTRRTRERKGDVGVRPAELLLQRLDQHAGRAHRACGGEHGEEGRAGDDPAIVDVAGCKPCREAVRNHGGLHSYHAELAAVSNCGQIPAFAPNIHSTASSFSNCARFSEPIFVSMPCCVCTHRGIASGQQFPPPLRRRQHLFTLVFALPHREQPHADHNSRIAADGRAVEIEQMGQFRQRDRRASARHSSAG